MNENYKELEKLDNIPLIVILFAKCGPFLRPIRPILTLSVDYL